ncbi:Elongation factor 2 [Orbilia ellipsospora]|uniref:Elongation factor 2 n=1 Tax=Orbilia ellipsospora TaxID=2528407 RepID=A0AAV9XBR4_9PEZI
MSAPSNPTTPVIKLPVVPKNAADMPKFRTGLLELTRSDPSVVVNFNDNGAASIACTSEAHWESSLKALEKLSGVEIVAREPIVIYYETISTAIQEESMRISANKFNRVYITIEPLDKEIAQSIRQLSSTASIREKIETLRSDGHKDEYIKRIMAFSTSGTNILVDNTKGIAYLNEVKDSLIQPFRQLTDFGPLYRGPMDGVKFNISDLVLHADASKRTSNHLFFPTADAMTGAFLKAGPGLLEPIYSVEIQVPSEHVQYVTSVLTQRRGNLEEAEEANNLTIVKGDLPVAGSFGFTKDLSAATNGKATVEMNFSKYTLVPNSDPYGNGMGAEIVKRLREQLGMGELKQADYYLDKP